MIIKTSEKNLLMRIANGFRASRGLRKNLDGEALVALAHEAVESKPEQEKIIDVTKNGTIEIIPDEGYTLSKVTAITKVNGGENKFNQYLTQTITEVTVEDFEGTTEVREGLFDGCLTLVSVVMSDSITKIDTDGFNNCPSLEYIKLSENLETIGMYAFWFCDKLTNLVIPKSVKNIYGWALRNGEATNKVTFTFLGTTPPSIATSTFDSSKLNKIIVPKGCGDTYKTATNWANFADYIEEAAE